jgi:hypothetical protein
MPQPSRTTSRTGFTLGKETSLGAAGAPGMEGKA